MIKASILLHKANAHFRPIRRSTPVDESIESALMTLFRCVMSVLWTHNPLNISPAMSSNGPFSALQSLVHSEVELVVPRLSKRCPEIVQGLKSWTVCSSMIVNEMRRVNKSDRHDLDIYNCLRIQILSMLTLKITPFWRNT